MDNLTDVAKHAIDNYLRKRTTGMLAVFTVLAGTIGGMVGWALKVTHEHNIAQVVREAESEVRKHTVSHVEKGLEQATLSTNRMLDNLTALIRQATEKVSGAMADAKITEAKTASLSSQVTGLDRELDKARNVLKSVNLTAQDLAADKEFKNAIVESLRTDLGEVEKLRREGSAADEKLRQSIANLSQSLGSHDDEIMSLRGRVSVLWERPRIELLNRANTVIIGGAQISWGTVRWNKFLNNSPSDPRQYRVPLHFPRFTGTPIITTNIRSDSVGHGYQFASNWSTVTSDSAMIELIEVNRRAVGDGKEPFVTVDFIAVGSSL